jgi:hypothetical protein
MSTVTPTAPINPLPAAVDNTIPKEERQEQLPIDKFVRATVAEGGQERVMLELNQRLVPAETRVPLKTGQRLNLLVVSTSPKLELQIIDDHLQRRLTSLLHLLNGKLEINLLTQKLFAGSNPFITALSDSSRNILMSMAALDKNVTEGTLTGNHLQQFVRILGLDLEALLAQGKFTEASLKSSFLELIAKFDPAEKNILEQAGRILQGLELFQLSQLKLAEHNTMMMPLFFDFLEHGFIIANKNNSPQPDADQEKQSVISMHLSLKNFGNLRIDFLFGPNGLSIRFVCDSKEKADFAAGFQEELRNAIRSVPLQGLNFGTNAEDPATVLITAMLQQSDYMLDTRA